MDNDGAAEELALLDSFTSIHGPFDLGSFRHLPGWKGKCIGDCIATINDKCSAWSLFKWLDVLSKSKTG